jgi:pSer/pThr/pTyr-binding forkhead associated (FHA) protein
MSMGMSQGFLSSSQRYLNTTGNRPANASLSQRGGMPPQLLLYNDSLGIRIIGINGGVIGRRQGPYVQFFQQQKYMSGVHAQLMFYPETGWHIVDKHSSNGTKLNDHKLQPDVEMSLKNGDIVTLANVVLKVSIN